MGWWPFGARHPGPHRLARDSIAKTDDDLTLPYFARDDYESAIRNHVARHHNVVLYGPARQGKTLLLSRCIPVQTSIYIECRPDFKRTHLYRLILSSLGYSISTEKKRSQKGSATIKFGLFGSKMGGEVDVEQEKTLQEINIDLKNPSEVAHLISRIPQTPYVILNGFHMLNAGTKENILFDLAFFTERSQMRYVIVGTWTAIDYLEAIEPAVTGKLSYLNIPYWSDAELRAVHRFWRERGAAPEASPEMLDQMILLAGGDISLFSALAALPRAASLADFGRQAEELAVGRSLRGLEARIGEFLRRKELALSYTEVQTTSTLEPNPDFKPIPGARKADYQRIAINPDTSRPYRTTREVAIDADGNPQYREVVSADLESSNDNIGEFLITELYMAARRERDEVAVRDLVASFKQARLARAVAVNDTRLKAVFLRIDEAQRHAMISPPLVAVDARKGSVRIADRRFYLALKGSAEDDFDELLAACRPETLPRPSRRARISDEVPDDEQERLKEEALGELGSSPVAADAGAGDTDADGLGDGDNASDDGSDTGDDEDSPVARTRG